MAKGPPKRIAINHDDYHAEYVGRTAHGQQFFLTTPFVPLQREFLALYLFNVQGDLLEARIDDLGPREQLDAGQVRLRVQARLSELGETSFRRIRIAPSQVERFGVRFGLIAQAPEEDGEDWAVTVEPGDYMAFYPPWDGDYDT